MSKRAIFLYAEDAENDVLLMKKAIAKAGLDIELKTVSDGEELIRYINGEGPFSDRRKYPLPTLLVLDLNLPKKNGFEILKWLRRQPHLKRMIVIVLTASRRQEDVDQSHELGANAVLVKPSTIDDLVDMVRQLSDWVELTKMPNIDVKWKSAL